MNHVLMHQTVIGQEAKKQMALAGDYPDVLVGCVGGGSNFGGIAFPFLQDKIEEGKNIQVIAAEPAACPTLTRGSFAYDFGDTAKLTPLAPMHTLGHSFVPPRIHSGGLRYHGAAPLVSQLILDGLVEARAYKQVDIFEAAVTLARAEGIIPAPEPAHAIKVVIDEAMACKEAGESKVILFNLCGHGLMDLSAYDAYFSGNLENYELPEAEIQKSLDSIKDLPRPV